MVTAFLAVVFTGCLFYARIPPLPLGVMCAVIGAALAYFGRHGHDILSADVFAQVSRLRGVNASLKVWTLLTLMFICAASSTAATGLFLLSAMFVLAVSAGGLSPRQYIHTLALPLSFLLISGLALLFETGSEPAGILNLRVLGVWLSVSGKSQLRTALVVSRALGAVSCLCLLGITTPIPDIIGVLRRVKCPELIIDLMYLIYRYIFILISLHNDMHAAAKSRLGFSGYRASLNATGKIYANLLARSYRFASNNFDAMESRCYDTGIRFLTHSNKISATQLIVSAGLICVSLFLTLFPGHN